MIDVEMHSIEYIRMNDNSENVITSEQLHLIECSNAQFANCRYVVSARLVII